MPLLRLLVLPLLLLAVSAAAQPVAGCPPPPLDLQQLRPDELSATARDRGALWRLDKDGRTSWLYGTFHVGRVDWAMPGAFIQHALESSDVLALELDPADPDLGRLFTAGGDAEREQRVLAGLQPRISALAQRACLRPDGLAALRPLFQLMMLGMTEARREGLHAEIGVDAVLYGMARRLGKEFVALETPAAQVAALVPDSEADERVLVERAVEDLESGANREQLAQLLHTWARGDAARLASYPQWCSCMDTPAEQRLYRRLNDLRNPAMADKVAALHAAGQRVFAAVGVLHMTGPQAMHDLMRERGFAVERIHFTSGGTP
jgi:uncharacterized protein YbaP (TraB family)